MESPGPAPEVTPEDVLRVFERLRDPCTPLTATEVANDLDCSRRTAHRKLEELADRGSVLSKKTGARGRVWWRPIEMAAPAERDRLALEQLGAFVTAVEDYAIFTLDSDGVVTSWNDGAEWIKGYTEEEIIGRHFSTFYTDEDTAAGVPDRNLDTAATEGRVEDEGWRVRADGSQFWADVTITAIRDDDGALHGFTKVTRDMTERREYEQQLHNERDLTEQILETMPQSISVLDSDGEFDRVNSETLDRLGIDESDLDDYSIDSWTLYDEDGARIPIDEWPWSRVLETGEPVYDYQCQVDFPDLGRRWLSLNAGPLEGIEDDRVVLTVDDITERKEYEQKLRRERDQTEELLKTAPIAIAVQDEGGETVLGNRRAREALGLSEQEFVEGPPDADEWTIFDADGEPLSPEETPWARVRATGEPVIDEEVALEDPSGERTWFVVGAAPVVCPGGNLERVIIAADDVTALKENERELERRKRELETELGEVFGRISDAFYALDEDWRFTHVNERTEELLQHPKEELLGESVWEVFPEAAEEAVVWESFQTAMETQEPTSYEVYFDPLGIWVEATVYPSETGVSAYFRDVTERIERERELAESRRRYRTLVENFPNGAVTLVDEDLRYTTVGGTPIEDEGVTPDDLEGRRLRDALSPAMADLLEPEYEAAFDGETSSFEYEVDDRVYQIRILPVRNDDGEVFAALGMSQEVTERRKREREVEEQREQYRRLVDVAPVAIAIYDADGTIRIANAAAADLAGAEDPEFLLGEPALDFIHPDDRDESAARIQSVIEDHASTPPKETRFVTTDGDTKHTIATSVPITYEGNPAAQVVLTDITEQKERERELGQYEILFEESTDVNAVLDSDGTFRYLTPSVTHVLGYGRDELVGDDAFEYVHPDDSEWVKEEFASMVEDPSYEPRIEFRFRHADGSWVVLETRGRNLVDEPDIGGVVVYTRDVTERTEYEQELAEYERIVETVDDGVYVLDDDGRFQHVNDAFVSMTRFDRADLVGAHASTAFGGEFDELDERARRQFETGGKDVVTVEEELHTAEAGTITVDNRFKLFPVEGGQGRIGVVRDVTDRKAHERALERYKRVFDTVDDGIYVLGPDFHFEEVNDAYAEMAGYEEEELIGSHCSVVVGEAVSEQTAELSRELASGEREVATVEADVLTKDGDRIPSESKFTALPTEGDEFQGSVGVVRDLTERREYERELEARARQQEVVSELGQTALQNPPLDDLFDEAVEAVAETLGNDYCKVLELLPDGDEVLLRAGVGWRDGLVGSATVPTDRDSQAGYTLLTEEPVVVEDLSTEERFSGPDLLIDHGVTSGISTIIGPLHDPWGVLGTHDTDHQEFSEHDVNFVRSVANILTNAIERAQYERNLDETIEKLEESNERLEQFAYVASHDLQEPLRMISNYLQLLEQRYAEQLEGDGTEFIEFAVDGAERMREMINDLLAYSRVDTNAEPLEPTDSRVVVDRVLDNLELQIEENDAEVVVGDLPTVCADDNQLEQLFQNLFSNALKYRDDDPPRIEIDAEDRGDAWSFSVSDNGIGIDPDYVDRIFEVFRRLHTHEEYPGTGIGLALCRKIVERHGGDIRVDSEPGDGSTFYFTIPKEGQP